MFYTNYTPEPAVASGASSDGPGSLSAENPECMDNWPSRSSHNAAIIPPTGPPSCESDGTLVLHTDHPDTPNRLDHSSTPDKLEYQDTTAGVSTAAVPTWSAGRLSHVDDLGQARMVDVSSKPHTDRHAVARCVVEATEKAESLLDSAEFSRERMRGIVDAAGKMGAARTPYLIPLCHQILLDRVEMQLDFGGRRLRILATVEAHDRTGVEMEALTAVTLSGLALVTALEARARIMEVSLLLKDGGRSGTWRTHAPQVTLLLFAGAREAAGTGRLVLRAYDVADVLAQAYACFGDGFKKMERVSACWVNSWPATAATALVEGDEVALLPPVSGG